MPAGWFFDITAEKRKHGNAKRENGPDAGARPATPGAGVVPNTVSQPAFFLFAYFGYFVVSIPRLCFPPDPCHPCHPPVRRSFSEGGWLNPVFASLLPIRREKTLRNSLISCLFLSIPVYSCLPPEKEEALNAMKMQ